MQRQAVCWNVHVAVGKPPDCFRALFLSVVSISQVMFVVRDKCEACKQLAPVVAKVAANLKVRLRGWCRHSVGRCTPFDDRAKQEQAFLSALSSVCFCLLHLSCTTGHRHGRHGGLQHHPCRAHVSCLCSTRLPQNPGEQRVVLVLL